MNVTSQMLEDHFAQVGNVISATVILDRYTGRSRNFGFVTFEDEKDVQAALSREFMVF